MRKIVLVAGAVIGLLISTVSPALGSALPKGAVPVASNQIKTSGSLQCAKLAGKWVSGQIIRRGKKTYFLSEQRKIANLFNKTSSKDRDKLNIAALQSQRENKTQLCGRLGYVAVNRTDFMAVGFGTNEGRVKKASTSARKIYTTSPSGLFGITTKGTTIDAFTSYIGEKLSAPSALRSKEDKFKPKLIIERVYDKPDHVLFIHYKSHPDNCVISLILYGWTGVEQCLINAGELGALGIDSIGERIFYSSDSDLLVANNGSVAVKVLIGRSEGVTCESQNVSQGILVIDYSRDSLPRSKLVVGGCGRTIKQFDFVGDLIAYLHSGSPPTVTYLSSVRLTGSVMPLLEGPVGRGYSKIEVIPTECGGHYELFADNVRATLSSGASAWNFESYFGGSKDAYPPVPVNKLANPYDLRQCHRYYGGFAVRDQYTDDANTDNLGGPLITTFSSTQPDGVCHGVRWDSRNIMRESYTDDGSRVNFFGPGWERECSNLRYELYGVFQRGTYDATKPMLMQLFPELRVIGDLSKVGINMPSMGQVYGNSFVLASPNGMPCITGSEPGGNGNKDCESPSLTVLNWQQNFKNPLKATILDLATNQLAVTRLLKPEYRDGLPYAMLIEAIRKTDGQLFFGLLDASGRLTWTDTGLMHPLKGSRSSI